MVVLEIYSILGLDIQKSKLVFYILFRLFVKSERISFTVPIKKVKIEKNGKNPEWRHIRIMDYSK